MNILKSEKSILNIIKYGPIILVLILSIFFTKLFISHQNKHYNNEISTLEAKYLKKNKFRVKEEIEKVHSFLTTQKSQSEITLKKELKQRVNEAHSIAMNLYGEYKNIKTKDEILKLIKDALRPIRFNNDRGYYYMLNFHAVNILHSLQPKLEGMSLRNFKDLKGNYPALITAKLVKEKGEGFVNLYWYKPKDLKNMYKKITYNKKFAPYDLYIGTGEYLVDYEKSIKERVLNQIRTIRYGDNGYIFIYDKEGNCLSHFKKELIGKNRINLRDKNGRFIVKDVLSFVQKEKSGFFSYLSSIKPNEKIIKSDKISFVKEFEDWEWVIGSGFYLEELNNNIQKEGLLLEKTNKDMIKTILSFSVLITIFLILLSAYLSNLISNIFREYKLKVQQEAEEKEKELSRNAQLYKDLFESNKSIILLIDPKNGAIISANEAACEFYGYKRSKLMSMNISDINTLSKEEIKKEMNTAKESRRKHFNFIHKLSSGELKNVRVTSSIAQYLTIPVLFSVITDTSEEYVAKENLSKVEDKFKTLFEFSNLGLAIRDKEGNFVTINEKLLDMLGYEEPFLLNKNCLHISINKNIKEQNSLFVKLINKEITNYNIEKTYIRKDGTTFEAMLTMASVLNNKGEITSIFSSIIDVSKLKEKERLLIQQSKMATMGEMLGSIAHQWKQPLSVISMSNASLRVNQENDDFYSEEEINNAIDSIDNSIKSLSQTIDDFRNFFNPNKEKNLFNVSAAFTETLKLTSSQFKHNNIEIVDSIDDIELLGSQNELQQTLINLLKNAKEELLKKESSEKRYIFIEAYKDDDSVIIKIKDNAGGIPIEILPNVFQAYFTTKEKEGGTGIGLYMCKQIIEGSMKGKIYVINVDYLFEDEQYSGAEFIIKIPLDLREEDEKR